jgi:hypothetical protein
VCSNQEGASSLSVSRASRTERARPRAFPPWSTVDADDCRHWRAAGGWEQGNAARRVRVRRRVRRAAGRGATMGPRTSAGARATAAAAAGRRHERPAAALGGRPGGQSAGAGGATPVVAGIGDAFPRRRQLCLGRARLHGPSARVEPGDAGLGGDDRAAAPATRGPVGAAPPHGRPVRRDDRLLHLSDHLSLIPCRIRQQSTSERRWRCG